jgi:hypothetical protein
VVAMAVVVAKAAVAATTTATDPTAWRVS